MKEEERRRWWRRRWKKKMKEEDGKKKEKDEIRRKIMKQKQREKIKIKWIKLIKFWKTTKNLQLNRIIFGNVILKINTERRLQDLLGTVVKELSTVRKQKGNITRIDARILCPQSMLCSNINLTFFLLKCWII